MKFVVALPMYNEENCAERSLRKLSTALDEMGLEAQILVVDDGSKDATNQILKKMVKELDGRLVLLTHEVNRGYGGAIKTAYRYAGETGIDYVLFMDADLTQDPKYIADFIPKMEQGVGLIKASRYVAGGKAVNVPLYRVVISWMGNRVSKLLFGLPINDYTNGFRAVRADLACQMDLDTNGFELLVEEVYQAKHLGANFCEVPYVLTARCDDDGCSSFSYSPQIFAKYLKFGMRAFLRLPPKIRQNGEE